MYMELHFYFFYSAVSYSKLGKKDLQCARLVIAYRHWQTPGICRNIPMEFIMLDINEIMEAAMRDDGTGFCVACGSEQSCCEPDAERYECEGCGQDKVYGAEQILLLGL
jgi:hypothetical protein